MQEHRISFATIYQHIDNVIEIVADVGINIDETMANEMFRLLDSLSPDPLLILANRKNSYSMSFKAQWMLASYSHVRVVAVLTHSRLGMLAARFIPKTGYPLKVFMDRDAALFWLRSFINTNK